ncbi:MAG: glycosyltransferase family 61 protein [Granulosicoccus sp.]
MYGSGQDQAAGLVPEDAYRKFASNADSLRRCANSGMACVSWQLPRQQLSAVNESEALVRKLARQLQVEAQVRLGEGQLRAALTSQVHALSLLPGDTRLLREVGDILAADGDEAAASLCYRGVVPDHINAFFFASEHCSGRLIPAKSGSDTTHLPAFGREAQTLPPPVRNAVTDQYSQFNWQRTESSGAFVSVIAQGQLWFDGSNTLVTDSKRQILAEHIKGNAWFADHAATFHHPRKLPGTVCFLDARSSSIYYHWMIDVLPKLAVLEAAGIALHDIDVFVVNATSSFQKATLAHLGVSADRIVVREGVQHWQAERLLVPYLKHDIGERVYRGLGIGIASWVPRWLKQSFAPLTPNAESTGRLYISRAQRASRGIADEAALIVELEARDFKVVQLETLTVLQQAELLSRCKVVLGAHGAGLTNMCFCPPGTRIIELFGDYVVPCYWALSQLAGLRYWQYLAHDPGVRRLSDETRSGTCNAGQSSLKTVTQRRDQLIDLDLEDFLANLDRWLAE